MTSVNGFRFRLGARSYPVRTVSLALSAPQVAAKQAVTAGHTAADELHLLTVHGVLHLLGYDHAEPDEEREMFGLQTRLLTGWQARARPQPS